MGCRFKGLFKVLERNEIFFNLRNQVLFRTPSARWTDKCAQAGSAPFSLRMDTRRSREGDRRDGRRGEKQNGATDTRHRRQVRPEALPEKLMIPRTCRVVEETHVTASEGLEHDVLRSYLHPITSPHCHACHWPALYAHVCLPVLEPTRTRTADISVSHGRNVSTFPSLSAQPCSVQTHQR